MCKKLRILGAILAILICADYSTFAQIPQGTKIGKVLHVNNQDPKAADGNPGTEQLPLKTVNQAATIALQNKKMNVGTKILIHPGTYRESIKIDGAGVKTDAPIVFEAKVKGSATVSGSDIWTGWTQQADSNVYVHPWPYKWGLAPIPSGWPGKKLDPIARRREMIFADGRPLEQVLSMDELREGSFFVSEEKKAVYIWLPRGLKIESASIEVSNRARLFGLNRMKNIVLRGLVFQHGNSPLPGSAVVFKRSSNVLVEDCTFVWNNWGGLGFGTVDNFVARRNVANHNGGAGTLAYRVKHLTFEHNETSYNNWRGAKGGFTGWAVAGSKHLRIHGGRYINHRAVGNLSRGFWFDYDNSNIVIEKAHLCDNLRDGIFIELNQGPITIKNSVICRSRTGSGILTTYSSDVILEKNILYGNQRSQIRVAGKAEALVPNWETKEKMVLRSERWTLKDNVIVGNSPHQLLLDTTGWKHFIDSLSSDENLWYRPGNAQGFRIDSHKMDLDQWQNTTGQDSNSTFSKPRFRDAGDRQ